MIMAHVSRLSCILHGRVEDNTVYIRTAKFIYLLTSEIR